MLADLMGFFSKAIAQIRRKVGSFASSPAAKQPKDPIPGASRTHPVYRAVAVAEQGPPLQLEARLSNFDFQGKGPVEFLEYLVASMALQNWGVFVMDGIHRDWIQEGDLPRLVRCLEDPRPCLPIVLRGAKDVPKPSTVAREAAFLIDGWQNAQDMTGFGGYPPSPHSGHASSHSALMVWWSER